MKRMLMVASVPSMIGQFNMGNINILLSLGYHVDVACDWNDRSVWNDDKVEDLKNKLKQINVDIYQVDFSRNIIKINRHIKSCIQLITLLRVFLNYYIDIDVRTDHDVYSFQILNNSQVVKMFDYLQKKQIRLNDRYGLIELYRTKDPVALNKYLDINFKKWAKKDNLDNPRDNNFLRHHLKRGG